MKKKMSPRLKKIKELTDAIYDSGKFKRSRIYQDEFNRLRVYEARSIPKTRGDYEETIMTLNPVRLDRLHKKYVKSKPKITKKRTMNKTMNDYMKAKEKARKAGKKSFTYKGKTYTAKKTKTGMTVYKRK